MKKALKSDFRLDGSAGSRYYLRERSAFKEMDQEIKQVHQTNSMNDKQYEIPDKLYEWFQTIEETVPEFQSRYVVVSKNGEIRAIAVLNFELGYSLGDVDRYPLLKDVFLSGDEEVEKTLFHGFKYLLKKERVAAVVLPHFYEEKPFQKYGYAEFRLSPNTCLELEWDSFEDYLSFWPPKRRHSIVSSLKKGDKKGLHVEYTRLFTRFAEELYQLKKNVAVNNHNPASILPKTFFVKCMDYLKDRGEMALCFKGDELVAFDFSLETETVRNVKFVGLNYQYPEAYYYLYVHAVKRGIEHGVQKMYFGRGTYTFKERLGCKRTGLIGYIKMKNLLLQPVMKHAFRLFGIHK